MLKFSVVLYCLCSLLSSQPVAMLAPDIIPCPILEIHCPSDPDSQKRFTLSVEIQGSEDFVLRGRKIKIFERKSLTYRWKLSAGKIVKGEGTPQITVDASGVNENNITATVEVKGFSPGCANKTSRSIRLSWESNTSQKLNNRSPRITTPCS